jgi:hypothetical protein
VKYHLGGSFQSLGVGGDTYVTDRLFEKAVLVMGVKGKERRVVLERRVERKR